MPDFLFVSDNFPPVIGGSATVYDTMCKSLGDHVIALTSSHTYLGVPKDNFSDFDQNCGYRVERTASVRTMKRQEPNRFLSLWDEVVNKINVMAIITKIYFRYRPRYVIIGELVYLGWIGLFARYILGMKVVIYTHGEEISQESDTVYAKMSAFFLKNCHLVISVSHFCKSKIIQKFNLPSNRIKVIHNGVDTRKFHPPKEVEPIRIKNGWVHKKVIFSIGRHVKRKGFENLIMAIPDVIQEIPNIKLVIGGSGPMTDILKDLVSSLNLAEYVVFAGRLSETELTEHYGACDLFSMTNYTLPDGDTEGFGLVFLEANAAGRPSLAGQGGGSIEAVFDGINGATVDANNISEISAKIIDLLSDEIKLTALAKSSFAYAQSQDWNKKTTEMVAAIKSSGDMRKTDTPYPSEFWGKEWRDAQKKPDKAGPRFIVTVDVEECFDWNKPTVSPSYVPPFISFENFHNRMVEAGVKPLYLLTYKMMSDDIYAQNLKKWLENGSCDLGLHMHSWATPPSWGPEEPYFSYQGNLPKNIEREKLIAISRLFKKAFGCSPKYHRAGIYGIGRDTLEILAELDIKVDLSPSSKFNFRLNGGPDFRNFSNRPFWYRGSQQVFCLPVTSESFLRGPEWLTKFISMPPYSQFSVPVRFSPEGNPISRLSIMCEKFLKEPDITPVISLHSSSLVTAGSPYSQQEQDAENNIECLFALIDLMQVKYGYAKGTIDDVIKSYEGLVSSE